MQLYLNLSFTKEVPFLNLAFSGFAGNELSGQGIGASVNAVQYGKDVIHLHNLIDQVYKNFDQRPLLLAPGGFYSPEWFSKLLEVSGPGIVNILTHHIYNLGPGELV